MKLFTSSQVSISNGENEIVLMLIFKHRLMIFCDEHRNVPVTILDC